MGVLERTVLGSEVRSVSIGGGFGLREGRRCDMTEGEREDGNEDKEVLRWKLPFELVVPLPIVPRVVGRSACIDIIVELALRLGGAYGSADAILESPVDQESN